MKYVLVVVDNLSNRQYYPFSSELDIETLQDELRELNNIAINKDNSRFSYLGLRLPTQYSRYVEEVYKIFTLEDWFNEYEIN
jgi:hypothetical protein